MTDRERPILFSGPMIRALLAGTKTQTRRLVTDGTSQGNYRASELLLDSPRTFVDRGPSPAGNPGPYLHVPVNARLIEQRRGWAWGDCDESIVERLYPRWFPGDLLWVRETWDVFALPGEVPSIAYRADSTAVPIIGPDGWKYQRPDNEHVWRPSIFLPRWASRITLEVTQVRVQRLQEISEGDAEAEGVVVPSSSGNSVIDWFACLWDEINIDRAPWATNPWTWCLSFKRVKP